ncbi:Hypp4203 [Branchiostoma lanceolatum]|uniref:Hypp4203 protein n=1 Tax=Branchiostoma lanceolatum TaxID=7740 RepID=A0A8K0A5C1_BRALA|nr:Hypp4203 [Branchiostoma lanceolatum]
MSGSRRGRPSVLWWRCGPVAELVALPESEMSRRKQARPQHLESEPDVASLLEQVCVGNGVACGGPVCRAGPAWGAVAELWRWGWRRDTASHNSATQLVLGEWGGRGPTCARLGSPHSPGYGYLWER